MPGPGLKVQDLYAQRGNLLAQVRLAFISLAAEGFQSGLESSYPRGYVAIRARGRAAGVTDEERATLLGYYEPLAAQFPQPVLNGLR